MTRGYSLYISPHALFISSVYSRDLKGCQSIDAPVFSNHEYDWCHYLEFLNKQKFWSTDDTPIIYYRNDTHYEIKNFKIYLSLSLSCSFIFFYLSSQYFSVCLSLPCSVSLWVLSLLFNFSLFFGVVPLANELDFDIIVSKFKPQSHYYVHLRTNTLGKGINFLILPAMG